jgi:hypothetical protein
VLTWIRWSQSRTTLAINFATVPERNEGGRPVFHEEIGQGGQHIIRVEPSGNDDRQTLAAELVDYGEHFVRPPINGAVGDEIVGL